MTDKKTEALKLALKRAFNLGQTYWQQADSEYTSQWKNADVTLASFNQLVEDTIREAQEEQPAQQQEPYAWMAIGGTIWRHKTTQDDVPLYTTLPHKPWVGLTDEEIEAMWPLRPTDEIVAFARAIEAKLKEKNHG